MDSSIQRLSIVFVNCIYVKSNIPEVGSFFRVAWFWFFLYFQHTYKNSLVYDRWHMFYFDIKIFKMKKDYLHEGAIADTADLVVLGAYFGTGNKGKKSSPLRNVFTIPLITNLEAEVFLECSNSLDYNTARI